MFLLILFYYYNKISIAVVGQDIVFGALGSDTSSVNIVRDFGFGGDEAAYHQAKSIITTTASVGAMLLAPVAQTMSLASTGAKPGKGNSTKQTKTTDNTGGNGTSGKTVTPGGSGKSTTSALRLKSGETDAVEQTKTAANAGTGIKIERYGTLKKDKSIPGQNHHLNQDAAYKNVIPKDEGMAIKLKGNILTQKDSPHYKAHKSLEEFWNQFREGGVREHEMPTNREYTKALYKSLQDAGLSRDQAFEAVKAAIKQRREYGLIDCGKSQENFKKRIKRIQV